MAAQTIIDAAKLTADRECVGASKFVCFANMVEDSPFMAGAVHGSGAGRRRDQRRRFGTGRYGRRA